MKDFGQYKFRASEIGYLMVDGRGSVITPKQLKTIKELTKKKEIRGLTEKQEQYLQDLIQKRDAPPELSITTKKYLKNEIWIQEVYGRKRFKDNKYLSKGIEVEQDSASLYAELTGQRVLTNDKEFSNDYITGKPDYITSEFVIDFKSSWDIWTFANIEEDEMNNIYYYQLVAYMVLTGKKKAKLVYLLNNTPEWLIANEVGKINYYKNISTETLEYVELEDQVRKNCTYDDIEKESRVKTFEFELDDMEWNRMLEKISLARKYLSEIERL